MDKTATTAEVAREVAIAIVTGGAGGAGGGVGQGVKKGIEAGVKKGVKESVEEATKQTTQQLTRTQLADKFLKDTNIVLTQAQQEKIRKIFKKIPANSLNNVVIKQEKNGEIVIQATSPARNIPNSKAIYNYKIDANGNTVSLPKTTYGKNGEIIHVKEKK